MTGRLRTAQTLAGRYQIVRLVARGGMGAVYQAEDTRLGGAPVAVKEMASSFVHGDTEAFEHAVADFRREAAMGHEDVVDVHGRVGGVRLTLATRRLERTLGLIRRARDLEALAPAAR